MSDPCNECNNVTVIEGENDPNLTERGEVSLTAGQVEVSVTFETAKSSSAYRFEYLYVDAFGVVNPGNVPPVVVTQTQYGFTVQLAAAPETGYVLRWRVTVVDLTELATIDSPESFREQIPSGAFADHFTITFQNPRSTDTYGFSELRVENLDDPPGDQTPIAIQVYEKTQAGFSVVYSPTPPTENYYLVGRTP